MKVHYDDQVDALYLELGSGTPDGAIELADGVNVDTTVDNKIIGIEILGASKKLDLRTILTYSLEFDRELLAPKSA